MRLDGNTVYIKISGNLLNTGVFGCLVRYLFFSLISTSLYSTFCIPFCEIKIFVLVALRLKKIPNYTISESEITIASRK